MTDDQHLPGSADCDCGTWSRRAFLGAGASTAAVACLAGSASGFLFGRPAAAAPSGPSGVAAGSSPPGRLVVIFLRGGADGLSFVAPVSDGTYHDLRPTIGIPEAQAIGLDATFGMHPGLQPLQALYGDGRLAFVHAVGNPAGSRSHFDAQAYMEAGDDGPGPDGRGWLGRHLATTSGTPGALARGAALSVNLTPSLRGSEALVVPGIDEYGLTGLTAFARPAIESFYSGAGPIQQVGADAIGSIDAISTLASTPVPGGVGATAGALGDIVALLGAGLGLEVVTLDIGGWDTHNNMGTATSGYMRTQLADFAANVAGFQTALDGAGLSDVTTIVMSEFGRRAAQNGSGGLDHGYGNVMTALGAGVAGGQVLTDWPGLHNLNQGDLDVTTDFRDVLWELVRDRLGQNDPSAVFPDFTPTPVGLTA